MGVATRDARGSTRHAGGRVVAATFISTFTVFGVVYSFGAFFDSMAEEFGTGKGATALMFSVTTAWYFGLGSDLREGRRSLRPASACWSSGR